jgi:ABC-type oligopeptide transport system substrate-binding subunit
MHAVAALLQGLPLQSEESDRGDLMEAKSALFLKYFTLFMNLLNDCSEAGNEEKESGARGKHSNAIQVRKQLWKKMLGLYERTINIKIYNFSLMPIIPIVLATNNNLEVIVT